MYGPMRTYLWFQFAYFLMQFTSYGEKSFRPNGSGFKKDHHKNKASVVIRVFPHSLELRLHLRRNSCPRICNHLLATKEETRKNIAIDNQNIFWSELYTQINIESLRITRKTMLSKNWVLLDRSGLRRFEGWTLEEGVGVGGEFFWVSWKWWVSFTLRFWPLWINLAVQFGED